MKVNIAKIKLGTGLSTKFILEEQPNDFVFEGEEIRFVSPLKIKGEITNTGDLFTVSGKADTVLKLNCSRCLEELQYPVSFKIDAVFAQYLTPGKDTDDDVRIFTGDEIMLDEVVMEALLLELPLKFLCREECEGLCLECGNNLNITSCKCEKAIDPRFGVLEELLKNRE